MLANTWNDKGLQSSPNIQFQWDSIAERKKTIALTSETLAF